MVPPGSPRPWEAGATAAYHITHVDNLASMARSGLIFCDSDCATNGVTEVSIAYDDLKGKRSTWEVEVAQGGVLADYVPFYYAPRSPMLFAIHRGYVSGYQGGQDEVAHLVFAVEDIAESDQFVLTDGHAVTPLSTQYDHLSALDEVITWSVMNLRYWRDTDEDGDRKRRRQAEFLVWSSVPFDAVRIIGVRTSAMAERVARSLEGAPYVPKIVVRPDWYY